MDQKKILRIKVPRKKILEQNYSPDPLPANLPIPEKMQTDDAVKWEDTVELKNLTSVRGPLVVYTADGYSVYLENFYKGRHAFLICSGPSLHEYDMNKLNQRGIISMGVNNSWSIFKPTLWTGVDEPSNFIDAGWKDASILKFVPLAHLNKRLNIKNSNGTFSQSGFKVSEMPSIFAFRRNGRFNASKFLTENSVNWGNSDNLTDELGIKGTRSVMLVAFKLLYYLGIRTIFLLGVDFRMEDNKANYAFEQGRNSSLVKSNNRTYAHLQKRFSALIPYFNAAELKVYNCNQKSGLNVFPHMPFDEAVEQAARQCSKPIDTEGWYDKERKPKSK